MGQSQVWPVQQRCWRAVWFLGVVGYDHSFWRNFSSVVAPLTDLLKANIKYVGTPICQQAFQNIKALLCSVPGLAAPCVDEPFSLQVDASHMGVGAVLMQSNDQGGSFFSKTFNKHQLYYSVMKKETLALVWALCHFEQL